MAVTGDLTDAARRVMGKARGLARSAGAPAVAPVHLAGALCAEASGVAATVLLHQRINVAAVRQRLGVPAPADVAAGDLPLSPEVESILELARLRARQVDSPVVSTGHLLVGVLRAGGPVAQLLGGCGIDLDAVDAHLDPGDASSVWETA